MAQERLTDQEAYTGKSSDADLLHLVRPSDTTDNAAGSSKKLRIDDLFKGRSFQIILGCLVFKFDAGPTKTTIVSGDWIIWMNVAADRMVLGVAKDDITIVPDDFDTTLKFAKFYDGSSLL
jgi:hypothetical protein